MILLRPVLMRRVWCAMHTTGVRDDDVAVRADKGAINIAHEELAAK